MPQSRNAEDGLADSPIVAARRMGIGRSQLYKELAAGTITARKVGRRTLIERTEQIRWLASLPTMWAGA
jgi:excisionase family DNA binding protein